MVSGQNKQDIFSYIVFVAQPYDNINMKKWSECAYIQIVSINVSFFDTSIHLNCTERNICTS